MNDIEVPENFDYHMARDCFLNPQTTKVDKILWKKPDYDTLSTLLKEKYSYSHDEVDRLTSVLHGGYYSVICGEQTLNQYKESCAIYMREKEARMMDSDED